jgi:hypothetical protein
MNGKTKMQGQTALTTKAIGKLPIYTVVEIMEVNDNEIIISLSFEGLKQIYSITEGDFIRDFELMSVFDDAMRIDKLKTIKKRKRLNQPIAYLYTSMK